MSRTVAGLPAGSRITDYISLGVVARTFPVETVRGVLTAAGKSSVRQRALQAHVVVSLRPKLCPPSISVQPSGSLSE
jgi:hypothetical protein